MGEGEGEGKGRARQAWHRASLMPLEQNGRLCKSRRAGRKPGQPRDGRKMERPADNDIPCHLGNWGLYREAQSHAVVRGTQLSAAGPQARGETGPPRGHSSVVTDQGPFQRAMEGPFPAHQAQASWLAASNSYFLTQILHRSGVLGRDSLSKK